MSESRRLLPEGLSQVHINPKRAELGLGTRPSDAAKNRAVVRRNEQRGHLENEFFGNYTDTPSETKVYTVSRFSDGGRVSFVGTPAGYWERGGLIVATHLPELSEDELKAKQDDIVTTIFPTHLPDQTRCGYTAAKLAGLQVSHEQKSEGEKALLVEHLTPDVYRPHLRMPRSVPLPHANFGNINIDALQDGRIKTEHLQVEQNALGPEYYALLALYMHTFMQTALRETDHDAERIEVRPHKEEPFGYKIVFDIEPEQLSENGSISYVSTVLDAQHQAYSLFGQSVVDAKDLQFGNTVYPLKPQPASRDYMHIGEEGLLEIVKSPILYSHSGGLEAAGITLQRGPQFKQQYSTVEVELFRDTASQRIDAITNTNLLVA